VHHLATKGLWGASATVALLGIWTLWMLGRQLRDEL